MKSLKFDKDINEKVLCSHNNLKTKKCVVSLINDACWESIHKLFPKTTQLSVSDAECRTCKDTDDLSLVEYSDKIEDQRYLINNLGRYFLV